MTRRQMYLVLPAEEPAVLVLAPSLSVSGVVMRGSRGGGDERRGKAPRQVGMMRT